MFLRLNIILSDHLVWFFLCLPLNNDENTSQQSIYIVKWKVMLSKNFSTTNIAPRHLNSKTKQLFKSHFFLYNPLWNHCLLLGRQEPAENWSLFVARNHYYSFPGVYLFNSLYSLHPHTKWGRTMPVLMETLNWAYRSPQNKEMLIYGILTTFNQFCCFSPWISGLKAQVK